MAPKTVELKLTRMHGGKPWMAEFDNKFVRAAGRAIEHGFGKAPVFNREGGSIPVVSTFQEELGVPSVLFGVGLPDENAHAPDEKLDLGNFHNGIIASAFLYQEIAKPIGRRPGRTGGRVKRVGLRRPSFRRGPPPDRYRWRPLRRGRDRGSRSCNRRCSGRCHHAAVTIGRAVVRGRTQPGSRKPGNRRAPIDRRAGNRCRIHRRVVPAVVAVRHTAQ